MKFKIIKTDNQTDIKKNKQKNLQIQINRINQYRQSQSDYINKCCSIQRFISILRIAKTTKTDGTECTKGAGLFELIRGTFSEERSGKERDLIGAYTSLGLILPHRRGGVSSSRIATKMASTLRLSTVCMTADGRFGAVLPRYFAIRPG